MTPRGRRKRTGPERPDLPTEFDPAPAQLGNGQAWTGVRVDESFITPDRLADIELTESVWTRVDLSTSTITGLRCRDLVFDRCDLSAALLDGAHLTRVLFLGCRLNGVMLTGSHLRDVIIEDSTARLANFHATHARHLTIERTTLTEADFGATELVDSSIYDCDLSAANFTNASPNGLALHGSTLDNIRGATHLIGVAIDPDQTIPLGAAMITSMNITIGHRNH